MSVLTLVRHGQATPFEKDTDRLSPLGEAQADKLASFWISRQTVFDEVYSGTLVRQQRTAEIVGQRYAAAGIPWPLMQQDPDFNEYDGAGILGILSQLLAEQDPEFKKLVETAQQSVTSADPNRHFQKMFEVVVAQWISGSLTAPGVESWQGFRERVCRGIAKIVDRPLGNRRVALFTSGGPIGVMVQRAVNAPPNSAIEINWRVRNSSLTDILFTRDKMTLDMFNALPHLDDLVFHSFR